MQKKCVRMATYNDIYPATPGPLAHTPPLFYKLYIYKVQLGKLIYESVNDIGPTNKVIIYTRHLKYIVIILDMLKMAIFIHAVSELPVLDLEDCKCRVNTYGKNYPTMSKDVEH